MTGFAHAPNCMTRLGGVVCDCPDRPSKPPSATVCQTSDRCSEQHSYGPGCLLATPAYEQIGKAARISECGRYRYWLTRLWGDGDSLVFVMLNPSTADASLDDPTIRRCIGFARREGFDGVSVVNLYAYRATDPKALLTCTDAVGPENDTHLRLILSEQARRGNPVVAAWGANARTERVNQVLGLVRGVRWQCLGTTAQDKPRHPLYVRGNQPLVPYNRLPFLVGNAQSRAEKLDAIARQNLDEDYL